MDESEAPWIRRLLWVLMVIFFAQGLWGVIDALRQVSQQQAKQAWRETRCHLDRFEAAGPGTQSTGKEWHLQVEYHYRIAGKTYASSETGIESRLPSPQVYRAIATLERAWERGESLPCWADPQQPNRTVLVRLEPGAGLWGAMVMGVLGLSFGLLIATLMWRSSHKKSLEN